MSWLYPKTSTHNHLDDAIQAMCSMRSIAPNGGKDSFFLNYSSKIGIISAPFCVHIESIRCMDRGSSGHTNLMIFLEGK